MESVSESSVFEYELDAEDRISMVSPEWLAFACDNDAGGLTSEEVIGRSLLEFISDAETRMIYHVLLNKARATGTSLTVKFRCDSPDLRRFMAMEIVPIEKGGIRLVSRVLRQEARRSAPLLDVCRPRSEEILTVCSWCKRVLTDNAWLEVEDAIERLHLFDRARLPQLSHGICPDCDLQMRKEFGIRNGA